MCMAMRKRCVYAMQTRCTLAKVYGENSTPLDLLFAVIKWKLTGSERVVWEAPKLLPSGKKVFIRKRVKQVEIWIG